MYIAQHPRQPPCALVPDAVARKIEMSKACALPQHPPHLNLSINNLGTEGVGILAGVLGQCASLTYLGLRDNDIGDERAERLSGVLGQCASLVHIDYSE